MKVWQAKFWSITSATPRTWENRETIKDVETFHHHCGANKLNAFLQRSHPPWERRCRAHSDWKVAEPQDTVIGPVAENKKRGNRSPRQRRPRTPVWTKRRAGCNWWQQRAAADPGKMRRTTKGTQPQRRQTMRRSKEWTHRSRSSDRNGKLHRSNNMVEKCEGIGGGQAP